MTSPYLLRPPRSFAQAKADIEFERCVRSMMWEQKMRDKATAEWLSETDNEQR
jgi:hypothetical protein